jgi:hypothetical protein
MIFYTNVLPQFEMLAYRDEIPEELVASPFRLLIKVQDYISVNIPESAFQSMNFDIWTKVLNDYKKKVNDINENFGLIQVIYNGRNTTEYEPDAGIASMIIEYICCYRHVFLDFKYQVPEHNIALISTIKYILGYNLDQERIEKIKEMVHVGCKTIEDSSDMDGDPDWIKVKKFLRPLPKEIEEIFQFL